ncbi:MAG: hypothetical protein QGH45_10780 [Myxococcota bacterium]|nr:hypothetical protein [Myxococcota bacterium]
MSDPAPPTPEIRGRSWGEQGRGSLLAFRFYFHFSRVVGRVLSYFCTGPTLLYYMLFAGRARRASFTYLRRVKGAAIWPVRVARGFRHIFNFAASLIDRSLLLSRGPGVFRLVEDGVEHVREALTGGRGAILLGAHLGNMEFAAGVLDGVDATLHQVMAEPMNLDLQKFIEAKGGGRFPPVIRLDGAPLASLELLKVLRHGDIVAMKSDRIFDDNWITLEFLGHPARFPTGPFTVAGLTGAPILLTLCLKEGGKTYRIIVEPPRTVHFDRRRPREDQVREWLEWYVERLEMYARRYPYQWYNFYEFWEPDSA